MAKKPGWGEAKCPDCSAIIKVPVAQCPQCGRPFTEQQQAAHRSEKRMGIGCLAVAGVIGLLALGQCGKSDQPPALPAKPGPTAKVDAIALFKTVTAKVAKCDANANRANVILAKGDAVEAYIAAQNAEAVCLPLGQELRSIPVPTSLGSQYGPQVKDGLEACGDAYVAKWAMLKGMGKALDQGGGVAALADIKQNAAAANQGVMQCTVRLMGVATALGATVSELGVPEK